MRTITNSESEPGRNLTAETPDRERSIALYPLTWAMPPRKENAAPLHFHTISKGK